MLNNCYLYLGYLDIGDPVFTCQCCQAQTWHQERAKIKDHQIQNSSYVAMREGSSPTFKGSS